MYKFTTNVRSWATGKKYSAGQVVPADFTIQPEQISQGVVVKVGEEAQGEYQNAPVPIVSIMVPEGEEPKEVLEFDYKFLTGAELIALLRERSLPVSGIKEVKIARLIENDKTE